MTRRQVLDCASPLALSEVGTKSKAPEGWRTPRRCRLVLSASSVQRQTGRTLPQRSQIFPIPCRGDALARRVGAGLVGARTNTQLAQFAHVPVLSIGHVPKLDRIFGIKIGTAESLRMKEPITEDRNFLWRLRPDLVHHHVIRMHAQKHVRKNRIIKHSAMVFALNIAYRQSARVATNRETVALGDRHEPA